jgi:probable LLM family oxidoreductase
MSASTLELGIDTFGDVTRGPDGRLAPQDQVLRDLVDEAVLADEVGIDFFGVGEHHRDDFAVSAPEVVLGAIAARTRRIRLGTAVTVLSSDDPVRVYQRFATLNALSNGRAEVILGRGSFTESFPLFGFDLKDYETLFEEKLDLFAALLKGGPVTWSGQTRPALRNQQVFPPAGKLPAWIGVGGSPESVIRAVRHDLPMILAIIGGPPARFRPFVDLYHRAHAQTGGTPRPLGVHSPGHVAETDEIARDRYWTGYHAMHSRIGRERGWGPITRAQYEAEIAEGSLYVGSPETVATKIAATVRRLGLGRFEMKYSSGPLGHAEMLDSVGLFGSRVIPLVRDMLA